MYVCVLVCAWVSLNHLPASQRYHTVLYPQILQCIRSKNVDVLCHVHSIIIKLGKFDIDRCYYLIHSPHLQMFFVAVLADLRSHIASSCHVSCGLLNPRQLCSLFLTVPSGRTQQLVLYIHVSTGFVYWAIWVLSVGWLVSEGCRSHYC